MKRGELEAEVAGMARQVAAPMGLSVVDVEFSPRGRRSLLRVILDRPGGILLDECARVSEELSHMLDAADLIPGTYVLEVSSPGLDRVLRRDEEFAIFRGRRVAVHTYAPVQGQKRLEGTLLGLEEDGVHLEMDGQEVLVPRQQVARVHLVAEI
ncbi:MAG: ribosome maturation factor RimP [Bacillota bacterium]|nr:ribosome maturation factor RimP [Bacillota bacterium]